MDDESDDPVNVFQSAHKALGTTRKERDIDMWHKWNNGGRTPDLAAPLVSTFAPMVASKVRAWKAPAVNQAAFQADLYEKIDKAMRTFNPNLGVGLGTHVENTVRQSMRYNAQHQNMRRMSEGKTGLVGTVQRAQQQLSDDFNRAPTLEELSAHTQIPAKRLGSILKGMSRDIPASRFEEDPTANQANRNEETISLLRYELNPREAAVFDHLFPDGQMANNVSTKEIAEKLKLSPFAVSRARTSILEKYKKFR